MGMRMCKEKKPSRKFDLKIQLRSENNSVCVCILLNQERERAIEIERKREKMRERADRTNYRGNGKQWYLFSEAIF